MKVDFRDIENRIKELEISIKNSKAEFKTARIETEKFLRICQEKGIKAVCIGVANKIVPQSVTLWRACEEAGISGGCGNTDQHQANLSRLVEGAYQLKNGKWFKVD